jgi:predicted RNase H-like HicB family nuclease
MKKMKYTVWKEDKYFVSQCLNVDISSFGNTIDEAVSNLSVALELYFEDNENPVYTDIENVMIGECLVNA